MKRNSKKASSRIRSNSKVALSHPDKLLYREDGFTKADLSEYYAAVADEMLRFVKNRPVSLFRCPGGVGPSCFFQKHPGGSIPALPTVLISERSRQAPYGLIRNKEDLQRLVQANVMEIHAWGSSAKNIERPDQIVFDLDPGPGVKFNAVIDAAHLLRRFLEELKLKSFPRLSGGKGIHVVVPIKPNRDWEEVKEFAKQISGSLALFDSSRFVAVSTKSKRKNRIYVDYLRNDRGATAIANYSTRARKGATVATPLEWTEVKNGLDPSTFNIRTVPKRIAKLRKQPWHDFLKTKQSLPKIH